MNAALSLLDVTSRAVEREHQRYHLALKALLGEMLDRADGFAPRARTELQQFLNQARDEAAREIVALLQAAADTALEHAESDAGGELPDEAKQDLFELQSQAVELGFGQIYDALRMDEDTILQVFRTVQLGAAMRAAGGTDPKVALDLIKGGAIVGTNFVRRDRGGNAWSTAIYSRTVARATLVRVYNEAVLMHIAAGGEDLAALPDGEGGQLVFSITGASAVAPSYEQIERDEIHPNITRLVERLAVSSR